jgi:hydrogenase expression/formation protein HypE
VSEATVDIGLFPDGNAGLVNARSLIGGSRVVDRLSGEQLPRIC